MRRVHTLLPLTLALAAPPAQAEPTPDPFWTTECRELHQTFFGQMTEVRPVDDEPSLPHWDLVRVMRSYRDPKSGKETTRITEGSPKVILCSGDRVEVWYGVTLTLRRGGGMTGVPTGLIRAEEGSAFEVGPKIRQFRGAATYHFWDEVPEDAEASSVVYIGSSRAHIADAHSTFRLDVLDPCCGRAQVAVGTRSDLVSERTGEKLQHSVEVLEPVGERRWRRTRVEGGEVAVVGADVEPEEAAEAALALAEVEEAHAALVGSLPPDVERPDALPWQELLEQVGPVEQKRAAATGRRRLLPRLRGPADVDKDRLSDDLDHCPTEPEDMDHFEDADGCPDPDNDKDGIPDADDGCPIDPEDKDSFEDADGCPDPDNDSDGLIDAEDACPEVSGAAATGGCPDRDGDNVIDKEDTCPDDAGPAETRGCPDADNDRVPDFRDKCPSQPIDPRGDPERSDGCPTKVFVTSSQIVILEKIFFEFDKAIIKPESYSLLDEVASVIKEHPELELIQVEGHTDSRGNDSFNLSLSQTRAEAVVRYLVHQGVDPSRLTAIGYGETRPLNGNDTEGLRSNNRRVEFTILKYK